MKNTRLHFFGISLLVTFAVLLNARGQATIAINNIHSIVSKSATSFGSFYDIPPTGPYTATPINITILGGPNANSLSPIATLSGPNAMVWAGGVPGRYTDPSGGIYTIPGVASGQPATLQVLAWVGNAPTFNDSDIFIDRFWPFAGNGWANATQFTFTNPTGGAVPASLDGMPAMLRLLDVPEPSVLTLSVIGGLLLGLRLRQR